MTEPIIAWIVEVNSEGNIESVSSPGATIPEEGSINEANGFQIQHVLSSELQSLRFLSAAQFLTENSWNGSSWVDRGAKPGTWYIWNNGWVPAQEAIELEVRTQREAKNFSNLTGPKEQTLPYPTRKKQSGVLIVKLFEI